MVNGDPVYGGGEVLAEVIRSGFVEGLHHGSVVVLDGAGAPVAAAGDVTAPLFPRSSNKPMQAAAMLRAGLRLADPADLALAAASHRGEESHVERVRKILHDGGLDESALQCPPDWPLDEKSREALIRAGGQRDAIHMNCSGKHAAMLRTCLAADWPVDTYRDPAHPLQQAIAAAIAEFAEEAPAATGVDGCGAPVYAISLRGLATAFLRLVQAEPGTPERAVADAMRAHPEQVSGTQGVDTKLMTGIPGLLAKGGAEGVQAVALPGVGAVAIKIDDGQSRAAKPVLASALRRLGVTAPVFDELLSRPPVVQLGHGEPVGQVRAIW